MYNTFLNESNPNSAIQKKMEKLLKELYRLNDKLQDENAVQSQIEDSLDAIDANLEMIE